MKQILASLKTGDTTIEEIPCPQLKPGHLLIQTQMSLISKGTEKMLVDFGKSSLLQKAKQQPERVRMVLDKAKADGLIPTLQAVRDKLDQLLPMGYCNVGTVLQVAQDVDGFAIGDRVASNGPHAEVVAVPKHLCCKIPASVSDEEAAFTILGAIALQGIRLANPQLGECFVVLGLGLLGLLTLQLLRANGCKVLGVDLDERKIALAKSLNFDAYPPTEHLLQTALDFSQGHGVDGVIITATTKSNEPLHLAAQMCRKRGRIILVGVTGLALSRADFYEKELSFQVSCSYGPGRYDLDYEIGGHDYPIAWVRFTEQRNFEALLALLAQGKLDVRPLITHRFSIQDAQLAYDLISSAADSLGVLLHYPPNQHAQLKTLTLRNEIEPVNPSAVTIGLIGAGNYASRVLIPLLKKQALACHTIACSGGVSGTQLGKKYGFTHVTTDSGLVFTDKAINTVIIASRHDTHAAFIEKAMAAKQHIFVEKPLCLTLAELAHLKTCAIDFHNILMIGFNRRFAPHVQKIKALIVPLNQPKQFIMTINAGDVPKGHWTQSAEGGGRIIGEACHFIDLLRFLADAPIVSYHAVKLGHVLDTLTVTLSFADGSVGSIHYLANGHRRLPKERLEVFVGGKVLQLDNFRKLYGFGWRHFNKQILWRQDKGQSACLKQFITAIKEGKGAPIARADIFEVSQLTIEIANSL